MKIQDIYERFKGLDIFEKRRVTDEYIEIVFFNKQSDKWSTVLTSIFGQAVKPFGLKPDKEISLLAEKYGGIYSNQALYKKDFETEAVVAMLWPWQDDEHTTLKIILIK